MKSINKVFAFILLVAAGAFASCESYLDIPQQGVDTIESFYKTDEQALNTLADLYTQWRNTYSALLTQLDLMADDSYSGWENMGDNNGEAHALNTFTFDATRAASMYSNSAGIVRRVNTMLARLAPDSPVKNRIIAECHVIRAWAYSYLNQMYGGVPLFEEEITVQNAAGPRASAEEIWALVNRDFEAAIASGHLPSKSAVGDKENILRITKEAAQAWYGKSLLWQEKWSESATQLKAVINSGKYQLMGDDQLRNHLGELDFGYVVRAKNNLSTEGVFEFNSKKDQTGNSGGGAYGSLGACWRADKLSYNGSTFSYVPEIDYVGQGWGGVGVTRKSLVDAFEIMEGSDGFRLNGSVMTWDELQGLGIGISGVYYSCEGYWDFKYRTLRSEAGSWATPGFELYNGGVFNALKPMRYAEVLLNAAEACIRSNDVSSALTYINLVRTRAHLAPLSAVTVTDLKKEKRLELYREGSRYIDLLRWEALNDADGITASGMLGEQGHYVPTFDGVSVNHQAYTLTTYGWKKGKHELMPIPQNELNANQQIVQNPNW